MNEKINKINKEISRSIPTGVSVSVDDTEEDDVFPMNWEYSLLINDIGATPTPLIVMPLGGAGLEQMVARMEEVGLLATDPVISVVGYNSWSITGPAYVLHFLVRMSTASEKDKGAVLQYVSQREYPAHILLNF